ncbi:type II toxin-antitoxin system PemK/MazF family toxin [filamentous cyanobacterium LEGE 11480]|uniref:Type II toxin-antitoxin system PemK/MazF family toxin n=1 Tax=Romeriopsis navalis LEGE 11480 TaxID=2777977 RepID=A0A928Z2C2_9CYAN|nr:type II toxin-antitoxin system PemK/MazF family toxin [Romeriopsis navalis]MBE9029389.1 type II toxin-antitoxin system PemK/MazF family toxin [Romeriopsis navalis LEGE 11480]
MTTSTTPKPNFQRGDVVLVLFPNSDLRSAKTKPALIIQTNNLETGLSQIIIAMITSNMSRAGHPSRYLIDVRSSIGQASGLVTDSIVMTDNLTTIAASAIYRVIGSLPMAEIDQALRHTLGL